MDRAQAPDGSDPEAGRITMGPGAASLFPLPNDPQEDNFREEDGKRTKYAPLPPVTRHPST